MKKKHCNIVYNIGLVLASVLVALVIAELGIRIFLPPQRHLAMYQDAKNGNHTLIPNLNLEYHQKEFSHAVVTNSMGFRNTKEFQNKDVILFIGDSFTFGSGVNEEFHYSTIFGTLLNWDGKEYNVYNAGVPGYSTINEYLYIKELIGQNLDIKKIFLGVDISDFNENLLFPIYSIQDGRLVFSTKEKKGVLVRFINFLAGYSELINFVYYRVVHSSVLKNYLASLLNLKYFQINLPDQNLQLFAGEKEPVSTKKLAEFKKYLLLIIDLCKKHDIELYVYYIPMIQEIYPKMYQNTLTTYGYKEEDFDLGFLNSYIQRICHEHDGKFLDIKRHLLKANHNQLYYMIDQHFNQYGNFITGISLYKGYQDD